MKNWFEVKVKYVKIDEYGRERKVTESYLIDAVRFTDAEARIVGVLETMIRGEFTVKNIKQSNISEIFPHESGKWWYKAKIGLVAIDEKAGKEKKINNYFLVAADDLKQALNRLEEDLSYVLVPFSIASIAISPILDVFPYFEGSEPIPNNLKPINETKFDENGVAEVDFEYEDSEND